MHRLAAFANTLIGSLVLALLTYTVGHLFAPAAAEPVWHTHAFTWALFGQALSAILVALVIGALWGWLGSARKSQM